MTEICLGCRPTKMEIDYGEGGNFLTLPTFDCTPGYAPVFTSLIYKKKKPHLLVLGYDICLTFYLLPTFRIKNRYSKVLFMIDLLDFLRLSTI